MLLCILFFAELGRGGRISRGVEFRGGGVEFREVSNFEGVWRSRENKCLGVEVEEKLDCSVDYFLLVIMSRVRCGVEMNNEDSTIYP